MAQGSQLSGTQYQQQQQQSTLGTAPAHVGDDLSRPRPHKREHQDDEAAVAYIKRILCAKPHDSTEPAADPSTHDNAAESLGDLLPPLTSSNAVDLQLYALIAVILSNFVQVWYSRITPDQQFVGEIVQIIAHCTRGLEQRLRHIDLEDLLLDELPNLLTEHVHAVRISQTSPIKNLTTEEVRVRFLTLRPHVALEPAPSNADASFQQRENEVAWCLLLVDRVMPLLLPPEDLQNPCLDVLVSEIFSELIFRGGIFGKATESWLIWDGVAKLLRSTKKDHQQQTNLSRMHRLSEPEEHDITPVPSVSGSRHGWFRRGLDRISQSLWFVLQCAATVWLLLRAFIRAIVHASSIPARTKQTSRKLKTSDGPSLAFNNHRTRAGSPRQAPAKRPIIDMHIWGCLSQLTSLNQRMPWLSGLLSLLQWITLYGPGQICDTDSKIDRLLSATIQERLRNPTWLPTLLQAARSALFPDNALAPARIPPTTSDELLALKRGCADAIIDALPEIIRTRAFATGDRDRMRDDVEADLDLLADPFINKHLILSAIELIAVRLFPELAAE